MDVSYIKRTFEKGVDLVLVYREQVILLLLSFGDIGLKADVLEPISRAQFKLQLVEREELDCLDLSGEVVFAELLMVVCLVSVVNVLVFSLPHLSVVPQSAKNRVFSLLIRVLRDFLENLEPGKAQVFD